MTETRFHITRVRQPGADWYDPQTDIRRILPDVLEVVTSMVEELQSDKVQSEQIARLHDCLRVFQLRITEDNTPLDSQLEEFFKALTVFPADLIHKWVVQVMFTLFCVYGLFSRRDSAVDRDAYNTMLDYTRLSLLKNCLPAGVWEDVRKQASSVGGSLFTPLVQTRTEEGGMAYCAETNSFIDNLKRIACRYMSRTGAEGWNELSAACDKAFMDGKQKSDIEQIALGLAYPSYQYPTMQLEVNKDGSKTEDSKTEDKGGPGPV